MLCRDDEDYDQLEKCIYVSAWKGNCLVIIEIVMSNHGHCSVLAEDMESAYRVGMFTGGRCPAALRRVADLSQRERSSLFHTHEDLGNVPWLLNADGGIEPASACDWQYLESAFNNDQAFFLKTIGTVNQAQMRQMLVISGRKRQTDTEMLAIVKNLADKWYGKTLMELTPEMKARILPYLYRSYHTTIPQLARCLGMPRDVVATLLPVKR